MRIPPMPPRDDRPVGDRCEVTLRDTFAAAALTGLVCNGDYSMESIPRRAFSMADAMLAERAKLSRSDSFLTDHGAGTGNTPEPVAWGVTMGDGSVYEAFAAHQKEEADLLARQCLFGKDGPLPLVPLYAAPQDRVAMLTDAERTAIADAADRYASLTPESSQTVATLRGLLERTWGGDG